jgi:hypothetical protein
MEQLTFFSPSRMRPEMELGRLEINPCGTLNILIPSTLDADEGVGMDLLFLEVRGCAEKASVTDCSCKHEQAIRAFRKYRDRRCRDLFRIEYSRDVAGELFIDDDDDDDAHSL